MPRQSRWEAYWVECPDCEGMGEDTFCPSKPDKCSGCEREVCPTCKGHGEVKVEPPDPTEDDLEGELDEALCWGGRNYP